MKLVLLPLVAILLASCNSTTTTTDGPYYATYHYNCYGGNFNYQGQYGGNPYYYQNGSPSQYCTWEYYNDQGVLEFSKDIVSDVAQRESSMMEEAAGYYADKFNLSLESGMKIARTLKNLENLKTREASDLVDFAQKLYGVNPVELMTAVSMAQAGDNSGLNILIEESAQSFSTSPENMKSIIEYLHGTALKANDIVL